MQFVDLPSSEWEEGVYCEFPTATTDSALFDNPAACYDVIVAVRHTDSYPFNTLFLTLDCRPAVKLPAEIDMRLADSNGKWTGSGLYGVYTATDTVAKGIKLPRCLSVSVGQNMHRGSLPGIVNVGLIIVPSSRKD